jgi:hypothetical protein
LATTPEELAQWMIERVHERGSASRVELIAELDAEFGGITELDRRVMQRFRKLHHGEIRYIANGQYWESLRKRPVG